MNNPIKSLLSSFIPASKEEKPGPQTKIPQPRDDMEQRIERNLPVSTAPRPKFLRGR